MLYKEIIQGSDEWKEIRYRKLGGSSNEDVMTNLGKPVSGNAIFYKLLGEFSEEFEIEEERFLSADVQRGNMLEPIAREDFSRIYGKQVFEIGWAESSSFTGISPDGIVGDINLIHTADDVEEAIEIKSPSRTVYMKYLETNDIAITDYAWQIVTYFKEFKNLKVLNNYLFRPENLIKKHILIKITRDMEIRINKTKTGKISDLVVELETRQNELKKALDDKIKQLKTPITQF